MTEQALLGRLDYDKLMHTLLARAAVYTPEPPQLTVRCSAPSQVIISTKAAAVDTMSLANEYPAAFDSRCFPSVASRAADVLADGGIDWVARSWPSEPPQSFEVGR